MTKPWVIAAIAVIGVVTGLFAFKKGDPVGVTPSDEDLIGRHAEHRGPIRCLTIGADGRRAVSYSERDDLLLWDVPTARTRHRFEGEHGDIRSLALSNDGKSVACGAVGGASQLWKLETGARDIEIGERSGELVGIGFSVTGSHLFSAMADGDVNIWQVSDRSLSRRIRNGEPIRSFALATDARSFVTGGERGGVRLWRVFSERPIHEFRAHSGPVRAVAISADSLWAASAGEDAKVTLWNLETGKQALQMDVPAGRSGKFAALAFSPGGTRVAGAAADGGVIVWSNEDGRVLHTFGSRAGPATSVGILPNSIVVVAGFTSGEVLQWRAKPPTASELRVVNSLAETTADRGRRLKDFADQMSNGKKSVEEEKWNDALACFDAARKCADPDSMECELASQSRRRADELRQYTAHLRNGEKLANDDRPDEARRHFEKAREVLPNRSEAQDALRRADNAAAVKRSFDGPKPKAKIRFDFDSENSGLLERYTDFAMLMTEKLPPLGLATSPIVWDFRVELAAKLPDIDVRLRVELYRHDDGKLLGSKDTRLDPAWMVHQVKGSAKPENEWKDGEYEIRLHLVTEDGVRKNIVAPVTFPLTMIRWQKKLIVLEPRQVLESRFEVPTGVRLSKGNGFRLRAKGKIAPGPAEFYRDIFDGQGTGVRWSGPEGFPNAVVSSRMRRYWLVANHLPVPALLWRIAGAGASPPWQPYREDKRLPPTILDSDGEIQLSINSVAQLPNGRDGQPAVVKDDKYWRPDSGRFEVELLRARIFSPVSLSSPARSLLLARCLD